MKTKEFVQKQATLEQLVRDKDAYLAQFRDRARALTSEIDQYLAENRVQTQIEAMSPEEQKAMRAGLAVSPAGGDD